MSTDKPTQPMPQPLPSTELTPEAEKEFHIVSENNERAFELARKKAASPKV